jgi:hypothetical protein
MTKLRCGLLLHTHGDLSINTVAAKLRCKQCGSRDCGVRIVWSP